MLLSFTFAYISHLQDSGGGHEACDHTHLQNASTDGQYRDEIVVEILSMDDINIVFIYVMT